MRRSPIAKGLLLLGTIALPWHVSSAMADTASRFSDALSLLEDEHNHGPLLNFHSRLRVIDYDGKEADEERNGVWYADLTSVRQSACAIDLDVKVYERYTAKRKHGHQTGFLPESSLVYRYVYEMDLSHSPDVQVDLANGHPSQLKDARELTCVENAKCDLTWLQFSSTAAFAQQASSLGHVQGRRTPTNIVSLPLSSPQLAGQILTEARKVLANCKQH